MKSGHLAFGLWVLMASLCVNAAENPVSSADRSLLVDRFAALALACVHQEYPNKIAHVMSSDEEVAPPRELTPVFYGCFDWHSSVHGHWLLVRTLRLHPDAGFAADAEAALERSFQAERVAIEVDYVSQDKRASFERPYGIAWFLQLMTELREWDDPRARRWVETLEPLETVFVRRTSDWLGKLAYPIRIGEHAQTAFAFGLMLDWAKVAGEGPFGELVAQRSMEFYFNDVDCPLAYEPGGQDFLSPCLAEADLMRRVLASEAFARWLEDFMPGIPEDDSDDWLPLAQVTDRTDGKLAHLDGLHLSRAWMLEGMAAGLPASDLRRPSLMAAAARQGRAGLGSVTGEHYEGGHWLGSFATYLVTSRGTGDLASGAQVAEATSSRAALGTARGRMDRWESRLNAVITLNPQAEKIAGELDAERDDGRSRSHLHGLPVLVKDNIETLDMPTTAGSLVLANNDTGRDAPLVARMREAGLVIFGKTNLSEWANIRDNQSTSGWSGVGGLTRNAWDPARSACGSSSGSGVAVAAGYVPFAVGTETNGSVVCPAAVNGIVGIKPTLGLVSRRGIVPIAHSQDTAGPMAFSVEAATMLLAVMEGPDSEDPASVWAEGRFGRDYLAELRADGLQGMRIGVIRSQNFHEGVDQVFDQAVSDLGRAGAELEDGLRFPDWPDGFWDAALIVLLYELKHDLNGYFASLPNKNSSLTLAQVIEFNRAHAGEEMPWFGQDLFEQAEAKGGLDEREYLEALDLVQSFTRNTLDALMADHGVDVLVMPTNAPAWTIDLVNGDHYIGGSSSMAAISGYPHITVPMGRWKGLPVGLSFVGGAFDEPTLIRAAYAYEQATRHGSTLAGDSPWALGPAASEDTGN